MLSDNSRTRDSDEPFHQIASRERSSMGCVSSKILTRSGSLQEKVNHGFPRSSLVEEIILSSSKSNGDQFLALLRTSSSAAKRSKVDVAEQSPASSAAAKIETIYLSELLAGLEEENTAEEEEEEQDDRKDHGSKSSPRCASDGAAGRAKSFRTVEEFDALVARSSSPEQAKPATVLAPERDASVVPPPQQQSSSSEQEEAVTVTAASNQDATATQSNACEQEKAGGAKRRARAKQLGELGVPPAFDFAKSGSLRDWLLGGGQIFSPGSYVTPKFGNVVPPSESEHGGRLAGEGHQHAVFDPELVAQFEQAMEQLSVDEERVLKEVLEVLEAGEKGETERLERLNDRSVPVQDYSST